MGRGRRSARNGARCGRGIRALQRAEDRKGAIALELVSCHTHTVYSGHGEGTVEELVAAAEAAGATTLAVTEHFPLSDVWDPHHDTSMSWEEEPSYRAGVAAAAAAHPGIEVVCGCEVDWLGAGEDRALGADAFAPYAWVLGSVHFIDGWAFDDPAIVDSWPEHGSVDDVWRRYFEVWCEAASSPWPFDAMSHPDLVKKFGFRPSFDPAPLYRRAAQAAAAAGRMVEVNTSGAFYPCAEMYPALDLLREFSRAGVECSVGSDAHAPQNVVRGIEDAYRLMREAGYRCVTVPTADGDRRRIPLE